MRKLTYGADNLDCGCTVTVTLDTDGEIVGLEINHCVMKPDSERDAGLVGATPESPLDAQARKSPLTGQPSPSVSFATESSTTRACAINTAK